MGIRRKRKSLTKPQRPRLQFESLESRQMMSGNPIVIPIVNGDTYSFRDADGTTVKIKLTGGGSGQLTLTNGLKTGGAIDTLSLTGTTGKSQLKITAAGGANDSSTINSLTIGQTPVNSQILQQFTGSGIHVAAGGTLQFNGSVGVISIETVGSGAEVHVTGGVSGQLLAQKFDANSSVSVAGGLASLNVQIIDPGAEVTAGTLAKISVGRTMTGASIGVGGGTIQSAFFQNVVNSNVWTAGVIESVTINGASAGSVIAANRHPGSDSVLNTIDDYTIDLDATGTIGLVKINNADGAGDLVLVATGAIGLQSPAGKPRPVTLEDAFSSYIPLEIAQAFANATGFDDDEIWIAVYGEEITTKTTTGPTYYLDAGSLNPSSNGRPTPLPISTSTLVVGTDTPNMAILPSSTLAEWKNALSPWGSNLQLPIPTANKNLFSGRILISVGAPVQAQVAASTGAVAAPSASSLGDPSTGTIYDFLEFTVTNKNGTPNLDVDTSQVDSFGLPMTLQFFQDVAASQPYNVSFTGSTTSGHKTISGITDTTNLQVGQVVVGPGIPPGAIIYSTTSNSVTLNVNASATASNVSLTAQNAGPVGVDGTRNEILDGAHPNSLQAFLNGKLPANPGARPFLQSSAPFLIAGGVPINGASTSGNLVVNTDSTANLQDNDWVTITDVQGTTAANGTFQVTNITANSFQLVGVTSNGKYVAGGSWSLAITGASNPGSGQPIVITASGVGNLQDGDYVEIINVGGNANANGFYEVSNVTATTFTLVGSDGTGDVYTSGGTWRVFGSGPRLVSPKDIVETLADGYASVNQLNNYFNEAIDDFFLQYLPANETNVDGTPGGGQTFTIQSTGSGTLQTYSGVVKNLGDIGYGLYLSSSWSTTPFVVLYPFTKDNKPTGYDPKFYGATVTRPWMPAGAAAQSASQMIFACDGYFADNGIRANANNMSSQWSKALGDIENSIASAFNRGISLNAPDTWSERSSWFQQTGQHGVYNYWVEYWHNQGVAVNDLAYAYPYDDKYGSSTNLSVDNAGLARVLLNSWSSLQQPTTTTFLNFPTSIQAGGQITLTAITGPPLNPNPMNGTITFFIDGVAINSNDFSANPPLQPIAVDSSGSATITATLPALPDGDSTHTFTVVALYSGDEFTAPSIASAMLQVIGSS